MKERVYASVIDGRQYRVAMMAAQDDGTTYIFESGETHTCADSDCPEVNAKATSELIGEALYTKLCPDDGSN